MNINKYLNFLIIFIFFILMFSCGNRQSSYQRSPESLTKDTLAGKYDIELEKLKGDSSVIYGTGNFDYRDSLESFHVGYSIPRDSIYKVYNTKAFQELNELIRKNPIKPGPYLDRGNHFQNIKMYREAISDYNEYIKRVQTNHSAYMNRGNAYERFKIYDSAMADYNMVLYLKPDDTIANFNKGNIYDKLSKHDSAVYQYDTVLMKDPRLAKGYYNRGVSYYYLGQIERTISDWEKAVSLNPRYRDELEPKINRLKTTGKLY